jgi:phosphoglycolate phosphatase
MLIIFDWDGTLCDSTGTIVAAMWEAARRGNVPLPADSAVLDVIGLSLPKSVEKLFPGLSIEERDGIRLRYSEIYRELDRSPAPLFPGARNMLENLRGAGHHLAVATGKSRQGLDRVLRGLDVEHYFHGSRCADESQSKPHPQMLRELLEEFDYEPAESLMIGDSEFDLEMARAAGIDRVGVSYGVHSAERLQRWSPLAVVDSLPELLSLPRLSMHGTAQ